MKECLWLARKKSTPSAKLAKEILSYFLRNPKAADSLEGVTHWRLLEERVHRQLEDTDQALEWLVQHNFLVRVASAWTEAVYKLNEETRSEAEHFLGKTKKGGRKPRPA